jgi:ribonuclease P protein component
MAEGREANISAKHSQASEETRLSTSNEDARREGGPESAPPQGTAATLRLIWRITRRSTFAALRQGRRARRGPITVSFTDGSPAEPPRVAFAIGRKVGSAVERNRLRRRLRAIVTNLAPQLRPGAYLIGASREAARLSHTELELIMIEALQALDPDTGTRRSPRHQQIDGQ